MPLFPIILTPRDEVGCYAALRVPINGVFYDVSVNKYRCDNEAFGKDAAHGGTQEAKRFKDRVLRAVGRQTIESEMSLPDFVGVFLGKGSRRNITIVLQWCDRFNLLDSRLQKQAALQKICDDYIGLDCNGFVGNWADENCISSIGPSTPPTGMGHIFRANKRTALEDIQQYDILVWNNHVAAVESIGPVVGGPRMTHRVAQVAEAYGAIMCRERNILAAGGGKFQVAGHAWANADVYGVGLGATWPTPLASQAAPRGG